MFNKYNVNVIVINTITADIEKDNGEKPATFDERVSAQYVKQAKLNKELKQE